MTTKKLGIKQIAMISQYEMSRSTLKKNKKKILESTVEILVIIINLYSKCK